MFRKHIQNIRPNISKQHFKTSQLPCPACHSHTRPTPTFPTLESRRRVRLTWSMIWSSCSGWCKWPRRNPSSRLVSGAKGCFWEIGALEEWICKGNWKFTPPKFNMALEKLLLEDYFPLQDGKVPGPRGYYQKFQGVSHTNVERWCESNKGDELMCWKYSSNLCASAWLQKWQPNSS